MKPSIDLINYEIPPSYISSTGGQRLFQSEMVNFIKGDKKAAILSAPTGSGKTHGFRMMGEDKKTILIVFPNNLLSNEVFRMFKDLNEVDISLLNARSINELIWEKKNSGYKDFTQRKAIGKILENKRFVITNPTVYYNLLNNYYNQGSKMDMLSELIKNNLSCVIFDEFHIYSRDQASMLLASTLLLRNDIKIVFSSATLPSYLEGVLKGLYGEDQIYEISAKRSPDYNSNSSLLQGRVNVHIVRTSATQFIEENRDCFKKGKWFLILDSIRNVHEAYQTLGKEISKSEIALISAYDDRTYENYLKLREGMSNKRLVICSNIVEQGINPPDEFNNFLIEPGYSPESFIQRAGRIGRGSFKTSELYIAIQSKADIFPDQVKTFDDLFNLFCNFKFQYKSPPVVESLGIYLWFIIDRLTKDAKEAIFENLRPRKIDARILASCFRTKKLDIALRSHSWIFENVQYIIELKEISKWWDLYRESIYDFIPPQNKVDILDTSEDFIEYEYGFATQYSEIWARKNKKILVNEDGKLRVGEFLTNPDFDFEVYVSGLPFGSKVKMSYGDIYFKSRKEILSRFEQFYRRYFDLPEEVKEILASLGKIISATAGPERLRLELV